VERCFLRRVLFQKPSVSPDMRNRCWNFTNRHSSVWNMSFSPWWLPGALSSGLISCSLVYTYQRIAWSSEDEGCCFFETLLNIYCTAWCYIPEDSNLHGHFLSPEHYHENERWSHDRLVRA
jgi:hypothetical protein